MCVYVCVVFGLCVYVCVDCIFTDNMLFFVEGKRKRKHMHTAAAARSSSFLLTSAAAAAATAATAAAFACMCVYACERESERTSNQCCFVFISEGNNSSECLTPD